MTVRRKISGNSTAQSTQGIIVKKMKRVIHKMKTSKLRVVIIFVLLSFTLLQFLPSNFPIVIAMISVKQSFMQVTTTTTTPPTTTTTTAPTTTTRYFNFDYVNDFYENFDSSEESQNEHLCESPRNLRRWKQSIRQRVLHLEKQCNTMGAYIHPPDPKSDTELMDRLVVDTEHKTIFCNIPKVASKNWRRVFLSMIGVAPTPEQINEADVYSTHSTRLDKLSNYDSDTVKNMLRSYRKILFVRDPFERLVSAYLDKFTRDYESCNRLFGDDIRKFRRNGTHPEPMPGFNNTVLFDEFARYVMSFDVSSRKTNDHWATYTELCRPCLINYTIIGKLEDQQTDVPCTLRLMLNEQERANYTFPSTTKYTSTKKVHEYYKLLTDAEVIALWKHFELDFRLLGYELPNFGRRKLDELRKSLADVFLTS